MPLPGGSADKLGNRFEQWWTVDQFLRMLHGELQSIRIEDPGVEKAEFVATGRSNRELHQAKRSSPSGKWSIAALATDEIGVVQAIYSQLKGNHDEYVFASTSDARDLAELSDRARQAQDPQEFEAKFLQAGEVIENFNRLCRHWHSCDISTAWDLLRRIQVRSIDERSLSEKVYESAKALFLADPKDVCAELRSLITDSVHKTITRDELINYLKGRGLFLRRLTSGASANAIVTEATSQYLDHARRKLIRQHLVARPATSQLLSKLGTEAGDSVLIGRAGCGKTGCVVAFIEELNARQVPTLVFRLDRIDPVSTTRDLGARLGFEESPALVLAAVAGGREAVLVIDQLDAVSTTSGRATSFLDAVEGLLVEARGLRHRLKLHVVVVCREFDWDNDSRLRALLAPDHARVSVGLFEVDEVRRILDQAAFDVSKFSPSQLEILRLPQNLSLFLDSGVDPSHAITFATAIDLFDRYWDEKRSAVASRARPAGDSWGPTVQLLAQEMAATQQLSVPREKLDSISAEYLRQMVSEGVLSFDGKRYAFGHESFFDYCFARTFSAQGQSLVAFLSGSEQHLFRRAQIRQVLAYLRESDRPRYLRELRELLFSTAIRPHLKDVALALLASVSDPSDDEWAIWRESIEPFLAAIRAGTGCTDAVASLAWRHFFTSVPWFGYAHGIGLVGGWLVESERTLNVALQYLRLHQRHAPDVFVELLEPYADSGGDWTPRLAGLISWANQVSSRRYLDFVLRLIDNGTLDEARGQIAVNSTFWSMFHSLGKERPEWVAEVLAHWLRRKLIAGTPDGQGPQGRITFGHDTFAESPISESAAKSPGPFVEHVLPVVLEVSDAGTNPDRTEPPRRDATWPHSARGGRGSGVIEATFTGLAAALASLAGDATIDLTHVIAELRQRDTHVANFMLLTIYRAGAARFAEEAAVLLTDEPWRFECGYSDSRHWTAMEAIAAIVPTLSKATRDRLESVILGYSTRYERSADGYKSAGHARFTLLSAIPPEFRSSQAQAQYEQLERKFGSPDRPPRTVFRGGVVGSPIAIDSAEKMSDENWLRAVAKYRGDQRFADGIDFIKGGAEELAHILGAQAEKAPERFAQLALKFPPKTNPVYYRALLRALTKSTLSAELKMQVCRRVYGEDREGSGGEIAAVLGQLSEPPSEEVVGMLDWLATQHPEPDKEMWSVLAGDTPYYGGEIHSYGINTARGKAADAIRDLIFFDSAYLNRFAPTLERMIVDPSPSVLACVAGTLRAVAHRDPDLALSLLKRMNLAEDRLLATPHMVELIHGALHDHSDEVQNLLQRMVRSPEADVAEAGARLAALDLLYHPDRVQLEQEALEGNAKLRLGIAQVAAANVDKPECRHWCEKRLKTLFDDDDEDVRREAATAFRNIGDSGLESYGALISAFCDSRAFNEDSSSIFYVLEDSLRKLPGMTCEVCEKFLRRFSGEAKDIRNARMGDGYMVTKLIFRTYQQHQDDEWTSRALDLIDRLCVEGIGDVSEAFGAFER